MSDVSWQQYRDRVRHEHPMSQQVELSQQVQVLADEAAELDAAATRLVRSLSAADFGTLASVIAKMWLARFTQVADAETDYGKWLVAFRAELGAGHVSPERLAAAMAVLYLRTLAENAPLMREAAPPLAPAADQSRVEPRPEVHSSVQPLSAQLTALRPRIALNLADAELNDKLDGLLRDLEQVRDGLPEQSRLARATDPDWRYVQWWCAQAMGARARSAALQGDTKSALDWFGQAAEAWRELDDDREVIDCEVRAAEARFAGDGNADGAIESLLSLADEAGAAERPVTQARLLTQAAEIVRQARDYYGASRPAEQAAGILTGLGFTDPTADAESAFGAWVTIQHQEEIAPPTASTGQAMLTSVALTWQKAIQIRAALAKPSRDDGPTQGATRLYAALERLRLLIEKLGKQARQAQAEINGEAAAAGLIPGVVRTAPSDAIPLTAEQERVEQANQALGELRQKFDSTQSATEVLALLPSIEELERNAYGLLPAGQAASASRLRAEALVELRRLDEAAKVLAEARQDLGDALRLTFEGRTDLVGLMTLDMAVQAFRGDFRQMSRVCGDGIAESEQDRYQTHSPYLQDSYLSDRRRLYDGGVFAADKLNDHELMLARCELAKARGILGWAVASQVDDHDATADQLESQLRALDDELAASPGTPDVTLTRRRRLLWERLMMARGRARAGQPLAFDLAAIQRRLAADEAVIYHYWLSHTTLLTITLDRDDIIVDKTAFAEKRDQLDLLLSRLNGISRLAERSRRTAIPELDVTIQADKDLLAGLLPATGRKLLAGKSRLILSPHGVLHQMPLHAFCLPEQDAPLLRSYAVRYIPNLTSLLLPDLPARKPHVLIAATADLPKMIVEANTIASIYGDAGECLTAGQATAGHLDDLDRDGSLSDFTALHLAVHGSDPPADEPFEAYLRLTDHKLDGLEISLWRLRANLVVLAACDSARRAITGRGDTTSEDLYGDEVFGLQAAFFGAGARQLLGAMWPAYDDVAAEAMTTFHRLLAEPQPADIALQKAVVPLLDAGYWTYQWAPFKLTSLGAI